MVKYRVLIIALTACGESGDAPPEATPQVTDVLAGGLLESPANFKVGDVYLYLPRDRFHPPFEGIRESRGVGHVACWSVSERVLAPCTGSLNQVKIHMRPGRTTDTPPIPMTERLASSTRTHSSSFQIEGTDITVYQLRNGIQDVHTFQAEDDLRIARCQTKAWCTVRAGEHHGVQIRYDFKVDLIRDWPAIDVEVRSLVASFVVNKKKQATE